MSLDLEQVAQHFQFRGQFLQARPHGQGHIHDTYAAWFRDAHGGIRRYLLQRINEHVFPDIDGLMGNIAAVTRHLHARIQQQGGDPRRQALTLVPTGGGATYWRSDRLGSWRAFDFVEGAQAYDIAVGPAQLFEAARAFGSFQALLADFPVHQLTETIPDFHHTPKRFQAFTDAVEADPVHRAGRARAEIAFVQSRAKQMSALFDLQGDGTLPLRVTHNDTKINNVLIDDVTDKAVCVIDLDTVMPGLAVYDFGDLVRSGASLSAEDEPDASKAGLDLQAYEIIVSGYLSAALPFLTASELAHLHLGARLMTLECGMRFLTDYLQGDVYFKTKRPAHNLDRCRTQFRMVEDMDRHEEQMVSIVEEHGARPGAVWP